MLIYDAIDFKFNRALLDRGSLKDISKASGVSIYRINKVLKEEKESFSLEESIKLGRYFDRSFARALTDIQWYSDLESFYPIFCCLKGSGHLDLHGWNKNDIERIKYVFLNRLDLYERRGWLKKRYISDLRNLLNEYLER